MDDQPQPDQPRRAVGWFARHAWLIIIAAAMFVVGVLIGAVGSGNSASPTVTAPPTTITDTTTRTVTAPPPKPYYSVGHLQHAILVDWNKQVRKEGLTTEIGSGATCIVTAPGRYHCLVGYRNGQGGGTVELYVNNQTGAYVWNETHA